jgi:hypothetical protein
MGPRACLGAHRVGCRRKEEHMGWFDNFWRRRQKPATETDRDTADARASEKKSDKDEADRLEEEAFRNRTEEVIREGRIPPGTG